MLRNGNPDRLMVSQNGAPNTSQTGISSGTPGLPTATTGAVMNSWNVVVGQNSNTIHDIKYLSGPNIWVIALTQSSGSPQTNRLETWQEDSEGVMTLKTRKTLYSNFTNYLLKNCISVKGDDTIGVTYRSSSTTGAFYEATISATGTYDDPFTTTLGTSAEFDLNGTYNAQEDRWVVISKATSSGTSMTVHTIVPGASGVEATDTRTTPGSPNRYAIASGPADVCLVGHGDKTICVTVDAGGGTVTFEDAGEITGAFQDQGNLIYNATEDTYIKVQSAGGANVVPYTVSGTTPTQGTGVTAPTSLGLDQIAYNVSEGRTFLSGRVILPDTNSGGGWCEVLLSGGAITFGTTFITGTQDTSPNTYIDSQGKRIGMFTSMTTTSQYHAFIQSGALLS